MLGTRWREGGSVVGDDGMGWGLMGWVWLVGRV